MANKKGRTSDEASDCRSIHLSSPALVCLKLSGSYDETKKGKIGLPLIWPNLRDLTFPFGIFLFIFTCGASAATQVVFAPSVTYATSSSP